MNRASHLDQVLLVLPFQRAPCVLCFARSCAQIARSRAPSTGALLSLVQALARQDLHKLICVLSQVLDEAACVLFRSPSDLIRQLEGFARSSFVVSTGPAEASDLRC
jgi:hypothetical protein